MAGFLTIEQCAFIAKDGERRDTPVEGDVVFFSDVEIGVIVSDVDVDDDEVGFKEREVSGIMEVDIENLAVAAPIAAEVDKDALVGLSGGFEGGSEVGTSLGWVRIDVAGSGVGSASGKDKQDAESEESGGL